jgi:nicotinamidase-related amidase
MNPNDVLLQPSECVLLMVDLQAGLGFGIESSPRQTLLNNAVALAKTSVAFQVPVIATTSASKVYSGPLFPQIAAALPGATSIERRNMNAWEDDSTRSAVVATGRKRLLVAGLLTEACVSFPALSALRDGFEVFVVGDTCGGLTPGSHELTLRRLEQLERGSLAGFKCFWSFSETGLDMKHTRPLAASSSRTAAAMVWDWPTHAE